MKEGSGDGHLFPWGSRWETWERVHIPGARVEEGSVTGVSPYRGPVGEPEKGGSVCQEL